MYSVLYHSKQGQGSKIQKSTAQKAKEAVESEKKKQAEAKKKQAVERGEKKQTAKQDFAKCPLFLGILARKFFTRHCTRQLGIVNRHKTRQSAFVPGN